VKVSEASGVRWWGLDRPDEGLSPGRGEAPRAFRRSSVAFRRASRASSSEVWVDTAFFFSDTAASRSARLLSILNRSFSAREKERAIVDCGLALVGCHSRSSSSSDILGAVGGIDGGMVEVQR